MPLAPQELRTYFIATVTASRRRLFQVEQNATLFLDVLQDQRNKRRLQLHAFVIMPDHAHLLLTPAPDVSLEKAMQYIKGGFSFRLRSKLDVWERSYDSRRIADLHD
jgi:putative transposase